jgi:ankyrin repeat protein
LKTNNFYQEFEIVSKEDWSKCTCDMDYGCHRNCSVKTGNYYVFPNYKESRFLYFFIYFREVPNFHALHLASAVGSPKYIEFLLENGAYPTLEDASGRIPSEIGLLLKNQTKNK